MFDVGFSELLLVAILGLLVLGPERLPEVESVYASPIAAAGRVYFVGRTGTTVVLEAGATLNVLAINPLDDAFDASPVAGGNQLFLRGAESVYCIEDSGFGIQDSGRERGTRE